jgi:hypothetical protein
VAGVTLKAALEAVGGEIENVDRFLAAVRKVERVGGRLQNTVIDTFTGVLQFWTYRPDEFLKSPVYSRDYPPCRHCLPEARPSPESTLQASAGPAA